MSEQPECPHDVVEKWVTAHGLACVDCLRDSDFDRYPRWRAAIALSRKRSQQALINFHLIEPAIAAEPKETL